MKYYIISSLVNVLSSVWACLFVILSNPRSKPNQTFASYCFSVAFWSVFFFLWITATNKPEAAFYIRMGVAGALFIPVTFLHFTCYLLNQYKEYSIMIIALYILNIIMVPLAFTPLFISHFKQQNLFPYWPMGGKLFPVLVLQYFICIGLSLKIMYSNLLKSEGFKRQQLKHVFRGFLIAFLGGSTLFPYSYNVPIPPFAIILISVYSLFITYSIYKYQLMNIKIIFKRSLIYSVLIAIITVFYFISIYLLERFFQEMFGYRSFFISLILASVITLAFIPLKNIIQSFIERYLFRGNYIEIAEENESLRREVLQTDKLKSVALLASGIAHEIKNPLTALKTFGEYLPKKINDKEFLKKFTPIICHEVDRIDSLVHELLDFAKPAPLQLRRTQIQTLLDNTLEFLSNDCIKHQIRVEKFFSLQQSNILNVDQNQFKQALLNIFLNAIDAMPHGGILRILTLLDENSSFICIKIQDNGIGITDKDLPHIFDPFFSKKDSGTGLGLSITHEIIKNHSGKIFVESSPGKGSTFTIQLPYNSPL